MTDDQEEEEDLFLDLILLMIVWTSMGICEVILSTLVLANLMICDIASSFTVNFVVTGITISSLINSESKGANCRMVDTLYFPFTTSFIMVTMLIFERFITIVFPFKYRTIITNKVAVLLVVGSWMVGFLLCSFSLFDPEHEGLYTRNGFCHTDTITSRFIALVFPNVVATFLAIIQIIYLSVKAHQLSKERQRRQSISRRRMRRIALSCKTIFTLFLLVGIAGVLGVIIPIILGVTRRFAGNETTAAKILQNGVVPFFGKLQTTAHSLLYGFYMTKVRQTIFKILKWLTCRT